MNPILFVGTNLQRILEDHKISELVIVGATKHICFQGTSRATSKNGYKITVVQAVATTELELGGVTVPAKDVAATVFATLDFAYAEMITTKELLELL